MAALKTYLTFAQLAPKLGFHGTAARGAAMKWCLRRHVPKRWRGNAWVVAEDDVQASLDGKSFVKSGPRLLKRSA